jgi:hypothetical protein
MRSKTLKLLFTECFGIIDTDGMLNITVKTATDHVLYCLPADEMHDVTESLFSELVMVGTEARK